MRGIVYGVGALAGAWWLSRRAQVEKVDESAPEGAARLTVSGASGVYRGASWKVARAPDGGWSWSVEVPTLLESGPAVVTSETVSEALDAAKIEALAKIEELCASARATCDPPGDDGS